MRSRKSIKTLLRENYIALVIIAAIIFFSLLSEYFFNLNNFLNILNQISIYGIVAITMTIAIICGEIDLSVSSTFPLSAIIFILSIEKFGVFVAILFALAYGLAIGSLNGFLVSKIKINSFIVTLGTMMISMGIALTITKGVTIQTLNESVGRFGSLKFGNLEIYFIIFAVLAIVGQIVLSRTVFGRNLYAVGGGYEVAKLAGIKVNYYKFIVFVLLGLSTSLSGILLATRLAAASPEYGKDLALYTISVVVIGGASLSGGSGSIVKTLLGLVFMGILFNGVNLVNLESYIQQALKGAIVVAVVLFDHYAPRARSYD